MNRSFRTMRFQSTTRSSSTYYHDEYKVRMLNEKVLIKLEEKFNLMNAVEIELDAQLNEFKTCLSRKQFNEIKAKINFLKQTYQLMPQFTENLKEYTKSLLDLDSFEFKDVMNDILRFNQEVQDLMIAIYQIESTTDALDLKVSLEDPINNIMPSVHSMTSLVVSSLEQALREKQYDPVDIRSIIDVAAKQFSATLYQDEKNSLVVQKLDAIRGHYLDLMRQNQSLYDRLEMTGQENQISQTKLSQVECEHSESALGFFKSP